MPVLILKPTCIIPILKYSVGVKNSILKVKKIFQNDYQLYYVKQDNV
jgi:hypothetical protein